jgi:hypothetical protein
MLDRTGLDLFGVFLLLFISFMHFFSCASWRFSGCKLDCGQSNCWVFDRMGREWVVEIFTGFQNYYPGNRWKLAVKLPADGVTSGPETAHENPVPLPHATAGSNSGSSRSSLDSGWVTSGPGKGLEDYTAFSSGTKSTGRRAWRKTTRLTLDPGT